MIGECDFFIVRRESALRGYAYAGGIVRRSSSKDFLNSTKCLTINFNVKITKTEAFCYLIGQNWSSSSRSIAF